MRIKFLYIFNILFLFLFCKCYNISSGSKSKLERPKIETIEEFEEKNKEILKKDPYVPLFEIEKDGNKSYIFGTNHCIIDKYFPKVPEIVKEKIGECDNFFSEKHLLSKRWDYNNKIIEQLYAKLKNSSLHKIGENLKNLKNKNISVFHKYINKNYCETYNAYLIQSILLFPTKNFKSIENELSRYIPKNKYLGYLDNCDYNRKKQEYLNKTHNEAIKNSKETDIQKKINLRIKSVTPIDIFLKNDEKEYLDEKDEKDIDNISDIIFRILKKYIPTSYAKKNNIEKKEFLNKEYINKLRRFYSIESYLEYLNGNLIKKAPKKIKNYIYKYKPNENDWYGKIQSIFSSDSTDEEILDDRNKFWIDKINAFNKNGFFFVGIGHLSTGTNSLFNLLINQGYKITHTLGNKTLEDFKKYIIEKKDSKSIIKHSKDSIKKIEFNPYYKAKIHKITSERLETIKTNLSLKEKEIIVSNYVSAMQSYDEAERDNHHIGFTKVECIKKRMEIYNHLVSRYKTD
ncbi:MAG: hypothetical protein GY830_01880 [Bacteroidetes bacterium]|nr:hypothetical protein [Bacteroidota bacterium]